MEGIGWKCMYGMGMVVGEGLVGKVLEMFER